MRIDRWGNRLYTGETSYDFVGRRRTWYTIGAVIVLLSLALLLLRGLNLGIDFTGGSEFQVSSIPGEVSESVGTEVVEDVVPGSETQAAVIGDDSVRLRTSQLDTEQTDAVRDGLATAYDVPTEDVTANFVGPSWGEEVSGAALRALVVFLALVGLTIALYFRTWKMAVAALIALLHDLVITVGLYALVGFEVTPASVIGFLTILGYSLYDTVVVFDKVRENTTDVLEDSAVTYAEAANRAVNQTLIRSINTSVVALLPVAAILVIGGTLLGTGPLLDLSLALFIGIAVGTYSSVFIATPLLVHLRERETPIVEQARRVAARRGGSGTATGPRGGATVLVADGDDDESLAAIDRRTLGVREPGQRLQPRRPPRKRR